MVRVMANFALAATAVVEAAHSFLQIGASGPCKYDSAEHYTVENAGTTEFNGKYVKVSNERYQLCGDDRTFRRNTLTSDGNRWYLGRDFKGSYYYIVGEYPVTSDITKWQKGINGRDPVPKSTASAAIQAQQKKAAEAAKAKQAAAEKKAKEEAAAEAAKRELEEKERVRLQLEAEKQRQVQAENLRLAQEKKALEEEQRRKTNEECEKVAKDGALVEGAGTKEFIGHYIPMGDGYKLCKDFVVSEQNQFRKILSCNCSEYGQPTLVKTGEKWFLGRNKHGDWYSAEQLEGNWTTGRNGKKPAPTVKSIARRNELVRAQFQEMERNCRSMLNIMMAVLLVIAAQASGYVYLGY